MLDEVLDELLPSGVFLESKTSVQIRLGLG